MLAGNIIKKCAELSALAYSDIHNYDALGLTLIKTIRSDATDTQGFIAVDHENKILFFVFRGTKGYADIATDFKFPLIPFATKGGKTYAHMGFVNAYLSIASQLTIDMSKYAYYDIILTGHSLGGALATIAASTTMFPYRTYVVTFGSPKVGDKKFKEAYKLNVPHSIRVVFEADIVPLMPPFSQFKHVHGELHLDKNGNILKPISFFKKIYLSVKLYFKDKTSKDYEAVSLKDHDTPGYIMAVTKLNNL